MDLPGSIGLPAEKIAYLVGVKLLQPFLEFGNAGNNNLIHFVLPAIQPNFATLRTHYTLTC